MKYLVLSDVHGNLPALEKLIKKEKAEVDAFINLGDVVNYAPWSNECVELIDDLENCTNIRGNHEDYFISEKCEVKHPLVPKFFKHSFSNFKHHKLISLYEKSLVVEGVKCIHTLNNEYVFHDSELSIEENTFIGHSHQQYNRIVNGYNLINPGSVGQNRKYINVANYMIWDCAQNTFELKSFTFDINSVINEMRSKGYPPECIEYYDNKKKLNV